MGNELITRDQLQSDLETLYNNKISPYLNGSAHAGFTPVGTIEDYLGIAAPQNYLKCDGSVVNIADYPDLADFIEDRFGSKNYYDGDGTTTFGLPTASSDITGAIKIIAYKNIYIDAVIGNTTTEITSPQDGQSLVYDATNDMWKNGAGGLHEYSTTEKVVGTWIDGRPIYEKIITDLSFNANKQELRLTDTNDINQFIDFKLIKAYWNGGSTPQYAGQYNSAYYVNESDCLQFIPSIVSNNFHLLKIGPRAYSDVIVAIQYIKTTDTPTVQS